MEVVLTENQSLKIKEQIANLINEVIQEKNEHYKPRKKILYTNRTTKVP